MEIKTDNGWYHINDIKPNYGENVIVILERESRPGCSYDFDVCKSVYRGDYFEKETQFWKVRYWRREELIPYPDGVVKTEIEECKKHNTSPYQIIEHQRKCGIEVKYV